MQEGVLGDAPTASPQGALLPLKSLTQITVTANSSGWSVFELLFNFLCHQEKEENLYKNE